MGRFFLVRHAQASFLGRNYDKLSATGENQARLLGEYWARRNQVFDRVYSGPCARHTDTARIAGEAFGRAGVPWPELVPMQEFDEYQADAVIEQALPRLVETSSEIRDLHRAFRNCVSPAEQLKSFQRMYEVIIRKWVDGELALKDVESWGEFCARVHGGLLQVLADGGHGNQVAVFSSGGPMGVAMQRALNLSPDVTMRVAWMTRNCAFSEFLFSGDRFTLSSFNAFPHLEDASLLTYR